MITTHAPKLTPAPSWEASQGETPPINLEARFSNGNACFFPYAYLGYCHFDKGGVIELSFASRVLRLEGRNLQPLFDALVKHAVGVVREVTGHELTPETELCIEKIEVVDADD